MMKGGMFKLRNLPLRTSSLLSVLLRTRSAQRLSSQQNMPELVPSGLFCPQPWLAVGLWLAEQFSQEKHEHITVPRHLVTGKEFSIKINFHQQCQCTWCSGVGAGLRCWQPLIDTQSGDVLFPFFLFSFLFFSSLFNALNKRTFTNK